jgi:hypothetical protein
MNDLTSWSNMLTVHEIKEYIDSLNRARSNLAANANLHLLFEVLMVDMPKKERKLDYALNTGAGGR